MNRNEQSRRDRANNADDDGLIRIAVVSTAVLSCVGHRTHYNQTSPVAASLGRIRLSRFSLTNRFWQPRLPIETFCDGISLVIVADRGHSGCLVHQRRWITWQLADACDHRALLDAEAGWRSASLSTIALVIIAALAALGEFLEVVMSSAGVAKAGGGRRSAVYAIVGSVIGGCAGFVIGVPLPVFGPLAGSLFFGSLGAMAGALLSELSSGNTWPQSFQIAKAAFLGRALGTLAKMAVGLVMVCAVIVGLLV